MWEPRACGTPVFPWLRVEITPSMFAGHDVSSPTKNTMRHRVADFTSVANGCSTPGQARAADGGSKLPHSTFLCVRHLALVDRREIPRLISRARLAVDPGALPCVPALRAKTKARDTPLGMTARDGTSKQLLTSVFNALRRRLPERIRGHVLGCSPRWSGPGQR
jgi:hypothetical protein